VNLTPVIFSSTLLEQKRKPWLVGVFSLLSSSGTWFSGLSSIPFSAQGDIQPSISTPEHYKTVNREALTAPLDETIPL